MKYSVKINASLSTVFRTIATASEREQWTRNVISITYQDPSREQEERASFEQKQKEGKMTNTYEGKNIHVSDPTHFSYKLMNKAFTMTLSYNLTDQGEMTRVEQDYEAEYHNGFARFIGKLFSGMTNRIAKDILDGLKTHVEKSS